MKQSNLLNVFTVGLIILSQNAFADSVPQLVGVGKEVRGASFSVEAVQEREETASNITNQKNILSDLQSNYTESPYYVLFPTNPDTGYRMRASKGLEGENVLIVTLLNGYYDREGSHHGEIIQRSIDLQGGNIIRTHYVNGQLVEATHTPTYTNGWLQEARVMKSLLHDGYTRLSKPQDKANAIRLYNELLNIMFKVVFQHF